MLRAANIARTGYLATFSRLEVGWFLANTDTNDEAKASYDEFNLAYAEAHAHG